ncbi:hypothetical protein FOZ63_002665, partial [Perkinsus olseni]
MVEAIQYRSRRDAQHFGHMTTRRASSMLDVEFSTRASVDTTASQDPPDVMDLLMAQSAAIRALTEEVASLRREVRKEAPFVELDVPRTSSSSSSSSPPKSLCLASAAGAILALATSSPALCEEPPDKKAKLGVEDAERYISSVVPHRPHSAGSSYDVLQRGDADVLKWQYYSDNGADLFYALVDVLMSITAGDEDVR